MGKFYIENYKLRAHYCRQQREKGGIAIFVHNSLASTNIDIVQHCKDQDISAVLTCWYCLSAMLTCWYCLSAVLTCWYCLSAVLTCWYCLSAVLSCWYCLSCANEFGTHLCPHSCQSCFMCHCTDTTLVSCYQCVS